MPGPNAEIKSLQTQLLGEISVRMPQYGFGDRVVGQSFRRPERFGMSSFHVSFIVHTTDFDVTADVGLRIDAVEELINADDEMLTKKEKLQTFTLGAELGNIREGKQRRWTISNRHHVPLVAAGVVNHFEQVGVPYLTKISDFEYLLYMLSNHDREAWLASPVHLQRCKTIVALARLLDKPEATRQTLCAQCDNYLRQRNDPGLELFRRFVNSIASM